MAGTASTSSVYDTPKGGLYGGPFDSSGLEANVRAVLMDQRWTTSYGGSVAATNIPYAFPTSRADYLVVPGYPDVASVFTFTELNDFQKDAVRAAFGLVASYTKLTFSPAASGLASAAAFRFANDADSGSHSNFPANDGAYSKSDSRSAGDTFLGGNGQLESSTFFGTDGFLTIIHEMGHAFGLKHGHDPDYSGKLADDVNDNEFSVMTYASYLGADTSTVTPAHVGSSPQSYMMFDIAALQAYYGANFDSVGIKVTYTWDNTTGQEYINGIKAANAGVTATGKIFSTVWTQGATTTFDLSNFTGDQVDDMQPGQWLNFSKSQIADLNSNAAPGTAAYDNLAKGNIYNSLLYNGNTSSEISNLIAGSGNDKITGNELGNVIIGNAGNDTIDGAGGINALYGGAGEDTLVGGTATGGTNQLWGGDDIDTVAYSQVTAIVYVDLGAAAGYVSRDGTLVLTDEMNSIENATGGSGDDTLIGDAGANYLDGGAGANALYGLAGNDTFAGGTATGGVDQLWGGAGTNRVDYSEVTASVRVDLGAGAGYVLHGTAFVLADQMNSIQEAVTGAGDDTLVGDGGANYLDGRGGTNALYGLDGDDTLVGALTGNVHNQLWGGSGSNTVDYSAQETGVYVDLAKQLGNVWYKGVLTLTDEMNSIANAIGGKSGDTLIGDGGINRFEGLAGADSLYANGGTVTFAYTSWADSNLKTGYDTIVDFILGTDKIDLSAFKTDFAHLEIPTAGTSHSVYIEQTPGVFNPDTDAAISVNTTVAGPLTASDFIF